MNSNLSPQNFTLNFATKSVGKLHNDIIFRSYSYLDSVCISYKDSFNLYITNDKTKKEELADLFFSDSNALLKSFNELEVLYKKCLAIGEKLQTDQHNVKNLFIEFLFSSDLFLRQYGKVDTYFTDVAVEKNYVEAVDLVEQKKNIFREYFNQLYFNDGSVLALFIHAFANHFNVSRRVIINTTYQDILDNFETKQLTNINDSDFVDTVFVKINDDCMYLPHDESVKVTSLFLEQNKNLDTKIITGTSVSVKGIFTGVVVKVEVDYKDMGSCLRVLESKQDGYVLVT